MSTNSRLLYFPQLLFPRLRRALTRLALSVWRDPVPLEVRRTRPVAGGFPFEKARQSALSPVAVPSAWKAPGFSTTWFRVSLPDGYTPRPDDHLHWDDNAEATAWLDGSPLFGFDATHRQWPWPKGAGEVWLESIFCQSGIWHAAAKGIGPVGSILNHARLVRKNEDAWLAYFDLEVLTDWLEEEIRRALPAEAEQLVAGFRNWPEMDSASSAFLPDGVGTGLANRWRPTLDRVSPLLRAVMRELDDAVSVYHDQGAAALRRELKKIYRRLRESGDVCKAVLTGHAHIDLVWLWPEATGEQKAVRTFATVRTLLDRYPEFHFGYSQPASYEAVERRAPGLMTQVRRQIAGGRWEATGAMYVESDTLMPCGEAILRSLLIGQERFKTLQGAPSPVLWLPDAFGFSGCLPRLMQLADVSWFFTNKLVWRMINKFPHSSFVWRGNDGAEVLAHVSRAIGYNNPARPKNLRLESEANSQADVHDEFLLPSGWGDGGGGPTADIIERVRRQADLRNQPAARWGRIDEFYARLEKVRDRLPVWRGEISLEAHRGTYTTQAEVKEVYRRLERALQTAEAARCAAGAGPVDARFWARLVFAQFHDCLPGSSVHEVYEEIVPELKRLEKEVLQDARDTLAKRAGASGEKTSAKQNETLFNPLPLPLQAWQGGKNGRLVTLPPLACSENSTTRAAESAPALVAEKNRLSNGIVEARFDRRGLLARLSVNGADALAGAPRLIAYRDVPYDLEAWEIDRQALDTGRPLALRDAGRIESGPGWAGLAQRWSRGESTVDVLWRLRAGGVALEVELKVDWREPESLLRFEAPTPFRGQTALFGAAFGGEWRLQQPGDPQQSAQWEVPANRWVMAADDGRQEGAFLLAEAKYGFSARDGIIGVSLLKSAKVTATTAFPPAFRSGPERCPWSDLGRHAIRLALGRLAADSPREAYPAALAETVFAEPLRVASGNRDAAVMPAIEGMPSMAPLWAVPVDADNWVLRLHESMGRRGTAHIAAPAGWHLSILEKALPGAADKPFPAGGEVEIGPFSFISLGLRRERDGVSHNI
ncbi:alpha-mannosidase [Termitidicoccus mucosus]|uniref:Glycoside hydrolase family 38 central domain-containing protein n=1 Tax=Termitidicoccus mucosus TaxID=1184151 RepID=A0A178IFG6_9BACT|nr:hypothetical protein AW736_15570 [Opitutaceae bacterium TSB47]